VLSSRFLLKLPWILFLIACGCHTVTPAFRKEGADLSQKKKAFVVVSTNSNRGFDREIVRNLKRRGLSVEAGNFATMPADADFYVEYNDKWAWDMVMYPRYLKIDFYEARSKELLGSAEFKNSFFHTYADPPEIVDELIGRIYGEPEGRYMR